MLRSFQCWKPLEAVELEGLSRRRLEESLPCKGSVRDFFSGLGISSVSLVIPSSPWLKSYLEKVNCAVNKIQFILRLAAIPPKDPYESCSVIPSVV